MGSAHRRHPSEGVKAVLWGNAEILSQSYRELRNWDDLQNDGNFQRGTQQLSHQSRKLQEVYGSTPEHPPKMGSAFVQSLMLYIL